jgi:signal recognition particle receptor subunit beta
MFGLDGSGKSSFLWLAEHPFIDTLPAEALQPTTGVLRLERKDVRARDGYAVDLDLCEIGGDERIRPFWSRYIETDVKVLVFLVDASAPERLGDAATQFGSIFTAARSAVPRIKALLVATRTDKPDSLSAAEVEMRVRNQAPELGPFSCVELALSQPKARASVVDLLETLANLSL